VLFALFVNVCRKGSMRTNALKWIKLLVQTVAAATVNTFEVVVA